MNTSDLPDFVACPNGAEASSPSPLAWCLEGGPLPTSVLPLPRLLLTNTLRSDGAKVAMKLFGRPDEDLLFFARNHVQAMMDNELYLEPMPSQEVFAAVLGDFDGKLAWR